MTKSIITISIEDNIAIWLKTKGANRSGYIDSVLRRAFDIEMQNFRCIEDVDLAIKILRDKQKYIEADIQALEIFKKDFKDVKKQ